MGIYLNPGNENFEEMTRARIYVDKTMMIREINRFMDEGNKYICISRPRRFGKTMAGNMLVAYYSKGCDSRALFSAYDIAHDESFELRLNKINVIKIDWNSEYQNIENKSDLIHSLVADIKREFWQEFKNISFREEESLAKHILRVYSETGETFAVIMDEYDVLVREQVDKELFEEFLSLLNGLFKSSTLQPAISLAYLTGILPIVRDKVQSKLNNFEEYTILDSGVLSEFVGFTAGETKKLCEEYNISYDECRLWYDGYHQNGYEIYNPQSVVKAVQTGRFANYWSKTSSYRAISDQIERNFEGTKEDVIRMISGESVDVDEVMYMNTLDDFRVRDDVFTYLMHLGYLAYDIDRASCHIPNKEVRQEWMRAIRANDEYRETNRLIESSKELLLATLAGNEEAVERALDESHIHATSNRSYNNEDALQSAIYLAYIYALNEYTVVREMTAGKGFSDVTYIPVNPDKPAMIIELKRNDSRESALKQIREKRYYDSLAHYSGSLLFVGINYDEKEKTHTCRIERYIKE